ncbi:MAG: ATP-binding protein, partial [Candidatus Marsarchaeota archaeon]|nr:ATP-binding protein [Candidatus Marsarchaeota archaeon]
MDLWRISNSKKAAENAHMKQMSEPDIRTMQESSGGIYLGKTLVYGLPFFLDVSVLTSPHIAVIGMTGSGKTFMLKNFIIRNSVYSEPDMLILDFNGEYRSVVQGIGGRIFRLGKDFKINLFEFLDYSQDKAIDSVLEIIEAYTKIAKDEAAALHNAISDAINNAEKVNLRAIADTVGGRWPQLKLKLGRLAGSAVFADATSFTISSLFKGATSIDLSGIESDVEKNFISYILVRLISESLNKEGINQKANKFIILDEAWKSVENIYLSRLFREG